MNAASSGILIDPLFQLNFVLWMLQPLPGTAPIRPVLREAGYLLDSISRPLPLPVPLRMRVASLAGSHDAPSPDVLAQHSRDTEWLIVECKARSFSPDSSTARQAIKLLAISRDLTDALGLPAGGARPGFLAYLTVGEDRDKLAATLQEIRSRLETQGIESGAAGVFGLLRQGDGVYIDRSGDDAWPDPLRDAVSGPTRIIALTGEEDPRLLYLIPWDPNLEASQEPEMRQYCKAVLFARLLTEATRVVGRVETPERVALTIEPLLSGATFGVFDRWRAREEARRLTRESKRLLLEVLNPIKQRISLTVPSKGELLEFTLNSRDDQDEVIDLFAKADPFKGPTPEPENQPPLFSNGGQIANGA